MQRELVPSPLPWGSELVLLESPFKREKKQEFLDLRDLIQETEKMNHPAPPHTHSCTLRRKQLENFVSSKGQDMSP